MSAPNAGTRPGADGEASEAEEESFLDGRTILVLINSTLLPIWIVVAGHIIASFPICPNTFAPRPGSVPLP